MRSISAVWRNGPAHELRRWAGAAFTAGRCFVLLCAVFICVIFVVSCGGKGSGSGVSSASSSGQPVERTLRSLCNRQLGGSDAPVVIEAVLPVTSGCQDGIGFYVADLAQARPDLFSVCVYDMKSDPGHEVMLRNGIKCAAVIINGTTRFDLGEEGGKVLLEGPMDPLDVYDVLSVQLATLSPRPEFALPEPEACAGPTEAQRREAGFK
jgi:hypothetical protein